MKVIDLVNSLRGFPSDADVSVLCLSWNPKLTHPVNACIDMSGSQTPTTPTLIIFAGPSDFSAYDNSGFGALESVQYQYATR